jgi:hypothetical protein
MGSANRAVGVESEAGNLLGEFAARGSPAARGPRAKPGLKAIRSTRLGMVVEGHLAGSTRGAVWRLARYPAGGGTAGAAACLAPREPSQTP